MSSTQPPAVAVAPKARWINVTAALYPLDSRYVAASPSCPATCLGKPEECVKRAYCCKEKGTSSGTVETLSYEHVVFFQIRCQGNINHDFHQSFWPFFWWTEVYNGSNFAILLDRAADHPNNSCVASYWLDDLFWALSKAKAWKVLNFSSSIDYCVTGQLHILQGGVVSSSWENMRKAIDMSNPSQNKDVDGEWVLFHKWTLKIKQDVQK